MTLLVELKLPAASFPQWFDLVSDSSDVEFDRDRAHSKGRHSKQCCFSVDHFFYEGDGAVSSPKAKSLVVGARIHVDSEGFLFVNPDVDLPISLEAAGKMAIARNEHRSGVFHASYPKSGIAVLAILAALYGFSRSKRHVDVLSIFELGFVDMYIPIRFQCGSRGHCFGGRGFQCLIVTSQSIQVVFDLDTTCSIRLGMCNYWQEYCECGGGSDAKCHCKNLLLAYWLRKIRAIKGLVGNVVSAAWAGGQCGHGVSSQKIQSQRDSGAGTVACPVLGVKFFGHLSKCADTVRGMCRTKDGGAGRVSSSSHADLLRHLISKISYSRGLRVCLRRASAHHVPMLTWAGTGASGSARLFQGFEFPTARRVMRALLLNLAQPAPARAAGLFLLEG